MEWNMHRIAISRNSVSPRGRPFIMYHNPELYGTKDFLHRIDYDENVFNGIFILPSSIPCDTDIYELAIIIMIEEGWLVAKEPNTAIDLYLKLRSKLLNII